MQENEKHDAIIAHLCKSKTFANAPTSIALLQYLYKASVNQTDLKESIIEWEFFGTQENSTKSNPKVRVNVYNLRKKLTHYYQEEGKKEPYRVVIDKGQYLIRFERSNEKSTLRSQFNLGVLLPYLLLIVLLTAWIVNSIPPSKPKLWEPFLSDKTKTTLFIGDAFGMMGTTITGNEGWTRDYSINSLEEFYTFCDSQPAFKNKLTPPAYAYTTQMGVFSALNLQTLFTPYKHNFTVRFSSQTTIADIKESNAIYAGTLKNNNPFIPFFNAGNPYFKLQDSLLTFSHHASLRDTLYVFPYTVRDTELAIVSKIKGPNNTCQLLFFSNHDIGVKSTFQYFTNQDSIKKFSDTYLQNHTSFTAIFRAKGVNRSDTELKLLRVVTF